MVGVTSIAWSNWMCLRWVHVRPYPAIVMVVMACYQSMCFELNVVCRIPRNTWVIGVLFVQVCFRVAIEIVTTLFACDMQSARLL
jgi:hypothetical protein